MLRSRGCLVLGLSLCLACPVHSQPTTRGTDKPRATDRHGDSLPDGAFARLGTLRLRHCGEVLALAFSPDGKVLLSGGGQQDAAVYLWDAATGRRRMRLPVERPVGAAVFSPDGKRIAAYSGLGGADDEKIIRVWDVAGGRELHCLELGTTAYSLCFSPDGKTLGVSGTDGLLMLWELGKPPRRLKGQKGGGQVFVFSPDGKKFATSANEFPDPSDFQHKVIVLRLWDTATGKILHEMRGHHEDCVNALAFSPDGKRLASGGGEEGNSVRLWDVATGRELPALERRRGEAWALRFSSDGRLLHAADCRGRTRAWRFPEGKALPPSVPVSEAPHNSDAIAFSPACDRLATGSWLGAHGTANTIYLWDLATGKRLLAFDGHEASVNALSFSADGKRLASLGGEGLILWDVTGRRPLRRFGARLDGLESLALSADGTLLAAGGREAGRVRLWEASTGKELPGLNWKTEERSGGRGGGVCFSPDGRSLLVTEVSRPARLRLFSLPDQRQRFLTPVPDLVPMHSAGFTAGGKEIVAACGAGVVRWAAGSGKELLRLGRGIDLHDVYGYWTDAAALSPDGRTLALGARNGAFGLWETATGKEIVRLTPAGNDLDKAIASVAFSPDNRCVLAGTWGGTLRCWDALTGEELAGRAAHVGGLRALAFTPDGRTLASAGADTTILLWDFPTLLKTRPGGGKPLDTPALEKLWAQLEGDDSRAAYRAIAALADASRVAFLAEKLCGLRVDRKTIERLIARLDDGKFAEREKAAQALKQLGRRAEADLKNALEQSPTLEKRRRIEDILDALPKPANSVADGERLRALRSLMVLERVRTPAARQLLECLAGESGDSVVRSEARAALNRLRHPVRSGSR